MPEYVSSVDEIIQNVLIFDQGKSGSREEKKFCQGRLKNVRHFVALPTGDVHIFAPGNFAMYADNDLIKRFGFGDRSGGEPPRILEEFGTRVGSGDARHHELETEFLAACSGLGIQPSSHPSERTYWLLIQEDGLPSDTQEQDEREILDDPNLSVTEKDALIKARRGQAPFGDRVRTRWQHACAVTGCRQTEVLRASHIKPWKDSTNTERLSYRNGVLLSANLDALFDKYLISFEDSGEMIISDRIAADERTRLGIPCRLRLPLSAEEKDFMEWHRRTMHNKGYL
jgi:putative restriction endonuclease